MAGDLGRPRDRVSARLVASRVLSRVARDAAFASSSLDAELARANLPVRDAALATEIVYGTLRHLASIDAAIDAKLKKGGKVDAFVRAVLRTSVYQLLHLDRIPPHAILNDAVAMVQSERGPRVGAFVNAVLRGITRADAGVRSHDAVVVPPALMALFEASLGHERAVALASPTEAPSLDLRVSQSVDIDALEARLRAHAPRATIARGKVASRCLKLRGAGDARRLPGYDAGEFAVQEEGAQVIAELVGARPGERVADVCAGRGGKTALLAEAVGEGGEVVAIDIHEGRLAQIAPNIARLGLRAAVRTEPVDLTVGDGGLGADFDRVLVDAPCTGLGTWWRRPELLARMQPDAPSRLGALARAILVGASRLVAEGGTLTYSVCSPTHEEGRAVAEGLTGFRILPFAGECGVSSDADGVVRLGPWVGTDAYQIIRFIRD